MKKISLFALGLGMLTGVSFGQGILTLDPAEAGPDFSVQGEYAGAVEGEKFGVQVVALGGGKFEAAVFEGGLPGAGADLDSKIKAKGERDGDVVRFVTESGDKAELVGGLLVAINDEDEKVGELKKVERVSPTMGEAAPEGATVLFDGTSADAWKGGKMTEDGLLEQGTTSAATFGDFGLHIEFLLPFKPEARGQGRGNSGIYLQGRYEVQVLDSFGLKGENNECGGIYSVKAPDLNMCFPPLAWQTYDVEFTAAKFEDGKKVESARMTVLHNGVVIHDDVEVPKSTTAAPVGEGPEPGPIYLQDHKNPVRYRNVWVMEK